jgi:hypothetical protein
MVFLRASTVCKKWKQGVKESLARKQNLSFAGWKMDDDSTSRLVSHAYNLRKLDMYVCFSFLNCNSSMILCNFFYDKIGRMFLRYCL